MLNRRRNIKRTLPVTEGVPLVAPKNFAQYRAEHGIADIISIFEADPDPEKAYAYAVQSVLDEQGEIEFKERCSYGAGFPKPYYVKGRLCHYLPHWTFCRCKVVETLPNGTKNELIPIPMTHEWFVEEFGTYLGTSTEYAWSLLYPDKQYYVYFTEGSTERYVIMYGSPASFVFPTDSLWAYIAANKAAVYEGRHTYNNYETYNVQFVSLSPNVTSLNMTLPAQLKGDFTMPEQIQNITDFGSGADSSVEDINWLSTLNITNVFPSATGNLFIREGVLRIEAYGFSNKSFIGDLVIPNSVTFIGDYAFRSAGFTGTLTLSNSINRISDYTFKQCGFTGDLAITTGVTYIGISAFEDAGFDGALTMPDSVTRISDYAFKECGFTGDLIIPAAVTWVGKGAFDSCIGFNDTLKMLPLTPIVAQDENPFANSSLTKVEIPQGTLDNYDPNDTGYWMGLEIVNYES